MTFFRRVSTLNLLTKTRTPPAWYGVAWREPDRDVVTFAPMPLNLALAWLRRAYWWLRLLTIEDRVETAYWAGYAKAREHAARAVPATRDESPWIGVKER